MDKESVFFSMYQYFTISQAVIHSYNIFLLLAFIVSALWVEYSLERYDFAERIKIRIRLLIPFAIIIGLFGASSVEIITQGKSFALSNFSSGFTFMGGFTLALMFVIAYAFLCKLGVVFVCNFFVTPLILAHAIGRVGCFFGGCCYGSPTTSVFGVVFPQGSLPHSHFGSCALHPTQLYESVFLFVLFIVIRKINFSYRFSVYCVSYGIFRFFLEFFRADSRGNFFEIHILSPSQLLSIGLVLAGIIVYMLPKTRTARI